MRTDLYLLTSLGRTAADLSIGTFCHENGHLLCRFPDMYDYGERDGDSVVSAGIGNYCLMGSGNHLDFGRSPSPVCSYLRDLAGWCDNEIDLARAGAVRGRARRLRHRAEVPHVQAERVLPRREPDRRWTSTGAAGQRPRRLPLRHPRLQRAAAGIRDQALPVRAAAGRRAPRPGAERQPGRRRRPVRPDRRHRAVGGVDTALPRVGRAGLGPRDLRHRRPGADHPSPSARRAPATVTGGGRPRWSPFPDNRAGGVASAIADRRGRFGRGASRWRSTSSTPTSAICGSP